jgi:hypothetical protein
MDERTETGTEHTRKKRGAPEGNQNARKHGFYSKVLTDEELRDFRQVTKVEGLDEEIALLRVKIKSIVENDPDNLKLIVKALSTLEKLVRTRYRIGREDRKGLRDAVTTVLRDIALPLGIGIGSRLGR